MGIIGMIVKAKERMVKRQGKLLSRKTQYVESMNVHEAELTRKKQELRQAQQIQADLKADQRIKVEQPGQQSKMKNLGKGMASHMSKGKGAGTPIGVPKSVSNQPVSTQQRGIFGGQRNLDVGGEKESPFMHKRKKDLF